MKEVDWRRLESEVRDCPGTTGGLQTVYPAAIGPMCGCPSGERDTFDNVAAHIE